MFVEKFKLTIRRRAAKALAVTSTITLIASNLWAAPDPGVLDQTHASVRAVMAVQAEATPDLMNKPGVLGTAVGLGEDGNPALVVYVDRDSKGADDLVRSLPPQLRGVAVRAHLTDKFVAYANKHGRDPGEASVNGRHGVAIYH